MYNQEIRSEFDKAVQRALENRQVSCRKGCAACCQQLIYLSMTEAMDIAREHHAYLESVRPQLEEQASRLMRDANPGKYWGEKCIFLAGDGTCSIYDKRPLTCRAHYVSTPAEVCANPEGSPLKYDFTKLLQKATQLLFDSEPEPSSMLPMSLAFLLCLQALQSDSR